MGITTTQNLGLQYPDGNEQVSNGPTDFKQIVQILDAGGSGPVATRMTSGALAARPAAASVPLGSIYQCTDVSAVFIRDAGSAWRLVALDNGGSPIGAMESYAGSTDPVDADGTTRWVIADGRALSRTTYATLFARISTTYGAGDGSTTFNIPDGRGRTIVGAGTGSGLTPRTLAQLLGAETHTHTTPALVIPSLTVNNHSHQMLGNAAAMIGFQEVGSSGTVSQMQVDTYPSNVVTYDNYAWANVIHTTGTGILPIGPTPVLGNTDGVNGGGVTTQASSIGANTTGSTSTLQPSLVLNQIIRVQ